MIGSDCDDDYTGAAYLFNLPSELFSTIIRRRNINVRRFFVFIGFNIYYLLMGFSPDEEFVFDCCWHDDDSFWAFSTAFLLNVVVHFPLDLE